MSNDRQNSTQGETAPRLAAAMEDVRAASARQGQGHERARLGRMGGGRRALDPEHEPDAEEGRRA